MVDLEGRNFLLDPAVVRRNDTSAASINEWTGEKLSKSDNVPDDIQPDTVAPLGNYAVQILWQDGFNQVLNAQHYLQLTNSKTLLLLLFPVGSKLALSGSAEPKKLYGQGVQDACCVATGLKGLLGASICFSDGFWCHAVLYACTFITFICQKNDWLSIVGSAGLACHACLSRCLALQSFSWLTHRYTSSRCYSWIAGMQLCVRSA